MPKKKRIAFLLGAGASQACGMPGTEKLTEYVRSQIVESELERHFVEQPGEGGRQEHVRCLAGVISFLFEKIDKRIRDHDSHSTTGPRNYEDVYDFVHQLARTWFVDYSNTIAFSYSTIFAKKEPLKSTTVKDNDWWEQHLAAETLQWLMEYYISLKLYRVQSSKRLNMKSIKWLSHAYFDDDIDVRDVVTLNHDNVLEFLFRDCNIAFETGFGPQKDGRRKWDLKQLRQNSKAIRLIKLHGSIDWDRERNESHKFFSDVSQFEAGNEGEFMGFLRNRYDPFFLVGATNKQSEYTQGIFWELLLSFEMAIQRSDVLIVCGYSFRDSGVNHIIYNWVDKFPNRKVLVLVDKKRSVETNIEYFRIPGPAGSNSSLVRLDEIKNLQVKEFDLRVGNWEEIKALVEDL